MNQKLWTKNFTIITFGTVISMLGNTLSGFGIGLLVLDYTGSTFLYALFMVAYNLPKIIMPLLAGPYLDKFSRRKAIYTLDFISAGMYGFLFFILRFELFNYWILLFFSMVIGSIDSIYTVAYDSLYPNLVSEGNYSKAYSISSMIYPLAAIMVPVAAYIYDRVGIAPIFLFNAGSFLVAAIFETMIKVEEKHTGDISERYNLKKYSADFKDGIRYIAAEKGLMVITVYFFITFLGTSAFDTLTLPYFKEEPSRGVMLYTFVMGCNVLGRLIGGLMHYKIKLKPERKFTIALVVYAATNIISMTVLYTPEYIMMALMFINGFLSVNSYNIRISSTQSYVPDTNRARFNGTFGMICSAGTILGQLTSGALADKLPKREIIVAYAFVNLIAVYFVMLLGRKAVKKVYNREL